MDLLREEQAGFKSSFTFTFFQFSPLYIGYDILMVGGYFFQDFNGTLVINFI